MHNKNRILELVSSTPAYCYDMELLSATLRKLKEVAGRFNVHYAVKANNTPVLLELISSFGLGADCVSGGEVAHAIKNGFPADRIAYAGVGKTDCEIRQALHAGIGCFNVESIEELDIISEIAEQENIVAPVALRINPDIDAHTHHYITTGLAENKFGISMKQMDEAVMKAAENNRLDFKGLHFHIGSQILTAEPFVILAKKVNSLVSHVENDLGIKIKSVNFGGGLGIDYDNPDSELIPDFEKFFNPILDNLKLSDDIELHCELGRAVVAQCGTLIGRVQYVKKGIDKQFIILDAGMNNLIRPALYQAIHKIENLTSDLPEKRYDVVGPICESADQFASDVLLPETRRGDLIAIRSAGAYGCAMSSFYNMRPVAVDIFF